MVWGYMGIMLIGVVFLLLEYFGKLDLPPVFHFLSQVAQLSIYVYVALMAIAVAAIAVFYHVRFMLFAAKAICHNVARNMPKRHKRFCQMAKAYAQVDIPAITSLALLGGAVFCAIMEKWYKFMREYTKPYYRDMWLKRAEKCENASKFWLGVGENTQNALVATGHWFDND